MKNICEIMLAVSGKKCETIVVELHHTSIQKTTSSLADFLIESQC